jgi:hypothetical protein
MSQLNIEVVTCQLIYEIITDTVFVTGFLDFVHRPKYRNRPIFRKVVFFLECRTMDKVQKSSNGDCEVPSSETFTVDLDTIFKFVYLIVLKYIKCFSDRSVPILKE